MTEIKIVNLDTGREVPTGDIGEVWMLVERADHLVINKNSHNLTTSTRRGIKIMKGYWNDPGESLFQSSWFNDVL